MQDGKKRSSIHIVEKQLKLQERPTNKKERKSKCLFLICIVHFSLLNIPRLPLMNVLGMFYALKVKPNMNSALTDLTYNRYVNLNRL